jgi:hypothetical protein
LKKGNKDMSIIKGLFGNKKSGAAGSPPPVGSISIAPGQTQEEQDLNRNRMEAELAAQKAAREARKAEEAK